MNGKIQSPDMLRIAKAITSAVQQSIEEIVAEEAKAAAERTEKRVRAMTSKIAANVLSRYDMEQFGHRLVITVDFKDTTP